MTKLLASVRNLDEARIALDCGADIIDLKEPANGALGAVPHAVARAVVAFVAGRAPVSATIGDLPLRARLVAPAVQAMAATGVDYIKIGLFAPAQDASPGDLVSTVRAELAEARLLEAASGTKLVAVLFADRAPDFALVDVLARAGFSGVMLDTAGKASGSLLVHLDHARLRAFCQLARARHLLAGLAGSLRAQDVANLLPLDADYLGFRGALCEADDRSAPLSALRIQQVIGCMRRAKSAQERFSLEA
jgi:(5-formylfuran-3-yl)methyl phosphate synthase